MNKKFVFDKVNLILLIVGVSMLIIGYFAMSLGDITLSPILISLAYLLVFPAAIMYGVFKKSASTNEDDIRNEDKIRTRKNQ